MQAWNEHNVPNSWEWVTFSELLENVTDSKRKLPQKEYDEHGEYPVLDQGRESVGGYSSREDLLYQGKLPVIIFGDHTRCIKEFYSEFIQGADGVKLLRPFPPLDHKFIYWCLKTLPLPDKGYSRHFKFLRASYFPLPPLNEQRRIVAKIEELTDRTKKAREALADVPELIEQFRRSVLAAAFRGDLTADWREQNSIEYDTWKTYELGELLSEPLANGRSVPTGDSQGFPVLRLTCLKDGYIDTSEQKRGLWAREDAKKFIVREGDFLIMRGNGSLALVGRAGLVRSIKEEIAYPDTMIRARFDRSKVLAEFLNYLWDSPYVRSQIELIARTTAGIHKVNQKTLKSITLPIPSLEEQCVVSKKLRLTFTSLGDIQALVQMLNTDNVTTQLRRTKGGDRTRAAQRERAELDAPACEGKRDRSGYERTSAPHSESGSTRRFSA